MKNKESTIILQSDTTLGFLARKLREYLNLNQNEIAKLARVSPKSVDLLEHNQPLPLDDKRRIVRELYLKKASRFS